MCLCLYCESTLYEFLPHWLQCCHVPLRISLIFALPFPIIFFSSCLCIIEWFWNGFTNKKKKLILLNFSFLRNKIITPASFNRSSLTDCFLVPHFSLCLRLIVLITYQIYLFYKALSWDLALFLWEYVFYIIYRTWFYNNLNIYL